MNFGDPQKLVESLNDPEFDAQRAPVRALEAESLLPTWLRVLRGEKGKTKEQSVEIETTALLHDTNERDKIAQQLSKDGATEILHGELEQESFELSNICVTVGDGEKLACARMNARVRKVTHLPGGWRGLIKEGREDYFWTVKIKLNDGNELTRAEYEGPAPTHGGALKLLSKEVQKLLKLKEPPIFKRADAKFTVKKTRRSYKYLKDVYPPRPCTGGRVDIDTTTAINGKKLKTPLVTVDVEGLSEQAIAECRNCLGLGSDEFSLRGWMKGNGIT